MAENRIVVSFDLRSSSRLIEDLTLSGNVEAMGQMLGHLYKFLSACVPELKGEIYQFTGDGWILLFPDSVPPKQFAVFLSEMCQFCHHALKSTVERLLESTPEMMGITIGLESGPLVPISFAGRTEWVGRAINVACRLQKAIKDKDKKPEYKALMSKQFFEKFKDGFAAYGATRVTRDLLNIGRGTSFECVKVSLFNPIPTSRPTAVIQKRLKARVPSPLLELYMKRKGTTP